MADGESYVQQKLEGKFGKGNVQTQQYLRDKSGKIVKGPDGTARRLDHVVMKEDGTGYIVETTSKTADKEKQLQKQVEIILDHGGHYIKDKNTGKIVDVSGYRQHLSRRK